MHKDFIKPNYNGGSFINVINSIKKVYEINDGIPIRDKKAEKHLNKKSKVVFLLVDAFGWKFYREVRNKSKFLKEISKNGCEMKITSQFPSTTTAHVTSVVTGEAVSSHGLFEWFTYDPTLDEVFVPFLYDYNEEENILPKENLFKKLKENGVNSTIISPSFINDSIYSKLMFKEGKVKGYDSVDEMFELLISSLKRDVGKNFYYLYYPNIDSAGHEYGMSSYLAQGEIMKFINSLDKNFNKKIIEDIEDTLFIITADHGQMEIREKIYINQVLPGIEKYMRKDSKGNPIVPVGYYRDMFLYIKDEYITMVKSELRVKLKGKAEIYTTGELINKGIFNNPSETFLSRVGDLVILPYDNYGIWWYEPYKSEINLIGSHGGLTKDEMEIPLLIYNF